jgi:hypothetical protein
MMFNALNFVILFICGLFNDYDSSSEYVSSDDVFMLFMTMR